MKTKKIRKRCEYLDLILHWEEKNTFFNNNNKDEIMKRPPIWDPQTAIGDGINPRPNPAEQGLLAQVILSADGRLRSLAMYPTAAHPKGFLDGHLDSSALRPWPQHSVAKYLS